MEEPKVHVHVVGNHWCYYYICDGEKMIIQEYFRDDDEEDQKLTKEKLMKRYALWKKEEEERINKIKAEKEKIIAPVVEEKVKFVT